MAAAILTFPNPARVLPWRKIARVLRNAAVGFVLFLVVGNLLITAAWQIVSRQTELVTPSVAIKNLSAVDDRVWRSAAPGKSSYEDLAAAGVTTIVDLRAEENLHIDVDALEDLGITWIHMPIRDGQIPSSNQVADFLAAVDTSDGITLVHCGAGVGRTGAMVAAYRVASGNSTGFEAMGKNLAVGPPSLEQLAFAATLDSGVKRPPALLVGASRVLDAPRRLWSRYGL
jgi:protein-tyrosine phosphatase